jgi:tocopherol O-methyltransferase
LSHFPNKALFFQNTFKVLKPGGKLALADWFKAEELSEKDFADDIKPIEGMIASSPKSVSSGSILTCVTDGMLLPPLCTQPEYVKLATGAGLEVHGGPKDISKDVAQTW